ncbi:MAG: TatD family hydrolase [Panacagrimonas sp.]
MVDSHCHLAGREFAADLPEVVSRAAAAGVASVLCILSDGDDDEEASAARLRALWPGARFATGIHPHNAGAHGKGIADGVSAVERRVQAHRAVALGEIGLDYHYDFAPRDVQQQVFREQIRLAKTRTLPIVIHTREADADTFRILGEEGARDAGGVFHCFTGDRGLARRALDAGFHLSLAGIVTFPRALELQAVARMVPLDRLLIETDSPFLAPVPFRGKRNEPAFVTHVAGKIGELRGVDAAAIGDAARTNFDRLFRP